MSRNFNLSDYRPAADGVTDDTAALMRCLDDARLASAALVHLEVRRSNLAAQALYQGLGFHFTGERPGYYAPDGEDLAAETARGIRAAVAADVSVLVYPVGTVTGAPVPAPGGTPGGARNRAGK